MPFAGYTWTVKFSSSPVGPGPNVFSDSADNVWVDTAGRLHLRITCRAGLWRCGEVILDRSLGYGSYFFTLVSSVGGLDPNVVLGLFTWGHDPADEHREIDIEFARWGAVVGPNAQYVVQPHDRVGHRHSFSWTAAAPTTHAFAWNPDEVSFRSATLAGETIASWTYSGPDVPSAADERARINLWLYGGASPTDGAEVEVVVSEFTFRRL
ncbi:MAG: glycoside hydrolase family 16 protein [Geodermatophilaceae bacterium]|nr:glycoside hydrolase family 16 protein [Geodermatophilaceae bacterium]